MISILVTGSDGQLGTELRLLSNEYPFRMIFTDIADLNITDKNTLQTFFSKQAFDYIVNCAAYTAVDKAESDIQAADRINHLAPGILAEIAHEKKSRLIHMSTDFVFNGNNCLPYRE
ncbi:MAG: sugar nucleotide-binding protein, partial [Bacteroidota bacterium]